MTGLFSAFGCLVAFASYNPFHGPILRDTLIVVVVDAITCIICGLCVFSTMGNLALEQGVSVDDVIADGPGLVFVVFPHALAKMPIPQLWSGLFFFMLILLGIDSQVSEKKPNSYIFRENECFEFILVLNRGSGHYIFERWFR